MCSSKIIQYKLDLKTQRNNRLNQLLNQFNQNQYSQKFHNQNQCNKLHKFKSQNP